MKKRMWAGILAFVMMLGIWAPSALAAQASIRLADFGDRGLELYVRQAADIPMLQALIAVDLAQGRSISNPSAQSVATVAASMKASPTASVESYVSYYTASESLKKQILEQASRLGLIKDMLQGRAFPFAADVETWYGDNWSVARGVNNERSHEGIDIAVAHGTPIRAMGDGVIEQIGWNTLGGWRIGLRDKDGLYYYYAHLSSFAQGMKKGQRVSKGQVIGFVGDTGYGPEGTSGQMSPHLHIGVYEGSPKKAQNVYAILLWAERNRW